MVLVHGHVLSESAELLESRSAIEEARSRTVWEPHRGHRALKSGSGPEEEAVPLCALRRSECGTSADDSRITEGGEDVREAGGRQDKPPPPEHRDGALGRF